MCCDEGVTLGGEIINLTNVTKIIMDPYGLFSHTIFNHWFSPLNYSMLVFSIYFASCVYAFFKPTDAHSDAFINYIPPLAFYPPPNQDMLALCDEVGKYFPQLLYPMVRKERNMNGGARRGRGGREEGRPRNAMHILGVGASLQSHRWHGHALSL